ncbi:MAG: porphobilinogen synthase [Flavobacteriaceae bacterium]|nr:porphobilinogen synthase [Flavobacteriaceae bacterium]
MFPKKRNRRLRSNKTFREMFQENNLSPNDFIVPLFITEGKNIKEDIKSMPDYYRMSIDLIKKEVKLLWEMGLKSVLLFPKIEKSLKNNTGSEALNPNGLIQRAIKEIKNSIPEMVIMTDVALDPYSSYGHDGIVENGNDLTVEILKKMAVSHASCGADVIAPSDMMDGTIKNIRLELEKEKFHETLIMSYSAKYASNFYGPFRNALDSSPGFGDKKTYQIDFHNSKQAIRKTITDIEEGADIVMIKPGLTYLDIVKELSSMINIPIASYQVSGEYSMLKAAAKKGYIDYEKTIYEQLIAFKRAGSKLIASYFAKEIVKKFL